MIRGIHYFSAEVKPKLMLSQGAALNIYKMITRLEKSSIDYEARILSNTDYQGPICTLSPSMSHTVHVILCICIYQNKNNVEPALIMAANLPSCLYEATWPFPKWHFVYEIACLERSFFLCPKSGCS